MSHPHALPQDMSTYLALNGEKQLSGSAPLVDPQLNNTLQWLIQQQSQKHSPHPSSPGIMIQSPFSSSQDDILGHFMQESGDDHAASWSTITQPIYSTEGLQIHLNGSIPQQSPLPHSSIFIETEWNGYPSYDSPNEANSSSPVFVMNNNYSPNSNNSLSPFSMQSRIPSNLPQLSPVSSDPSLSPLYGTSRLGTPTTPSQSFMPSPTLSQTDHMLQQEAQFLTVDSDRLLYTHRQQLQMFREALSLPGEGAGPFVPQPMYKPHTTSDRKRYVEDVMLEPPIFFRVEHSNQFGISLGDALHSRVKNLVDREQVVFEGRGPSVSIRLEWPGYRQWSRQIPTKDFRSPPGPITIAKLAKNVAKCVQRFMLDRKSLPMEDGSDDKWRIGDGSNDIKLEDLLLVSIHHVSLGSWQPHLRLRRPRSNIPIQSSSISSSPNNVSFPY